MSFGDQRMEDWESEPTYVGERIVRKPEVIVLREPLAWSVVEQDGRRTVVSRDEHDSSVTMYEALELNPEETVVIPVDQDKTNIRFSVAREALDTVYRYFGYVLIPENLVRPETKPFPKIIIGTTSVLSIGHDRKVRMQKDVPLLARPRVATFFGKDGARTDMAEFSMERFREQLADRGLSIQEDPVAPDQSPILIYDRSPREFPRTGRYVTVSYYLSNGAETIEGLSSLDFMVKARAKRWNPIVRSGEDLPIESLELTEV